MSMYAPQSDVRTEPGSPLWWLCTLERRLQDRQSKMLQFDAWYTGDHPLPFLTKSHQSKLKDEFKRLLTESRANFMRLVVDATEERLAVEGFRLSSEQGSGSDKASWDMWQANQMDAQSQTAIIESLIKGVSYLSVWSDEDGDGYADIAVEDPLQTIVAYEPGSNYRRRAAAVKVWLDDLTGTRRANVYLPDAIHKFEAQATVPSSTPTPEDQSRIAWAELETKRVPNPSGVVPIIPLRNHPRLLTEGESELEDVVLIQGQINSFLFMLALAGFFGAHRQLWVTGLTLMEDKNGKPVEPFKVAVDQLLQAEDPNVKFGQFDATDLGNYIKAIDQAVTHIAVTSRTPRHYMIQQGQSPSGDALKSAEAGLVKKVTRKQRAFGEGFEEAIRLARRFQGANDTPVDSEIVWAEPAQHADGVITDAIVKQYLVGLIPKDVGLQRLGYSQAQIRRILATPESEFAPPLADSATVAMEDKSAILARSLTEK